MVDNRYSHYRAQLTSANGTVLGDFRVLAHAGIAGTTDSEIFLAPDGPFPNSATSVSLIAKFFEVTTDGQEGLGPFFPVFGRPQSNVRIGFAFHTNPSDPNANRYPAEGHSGDIAGLVEAMRLAGDRAAFVQYEILMDNRFGDPTLPLSPNLPTITVDDLVLPFAF